jgi:IS30 family transposase
MMLAKVADKDSRTTHKAGEEATNCMIPDLGRGPNFRITSLYVCDQHRRQFLEPAKPVVVWVDREHQWFTEQYSPKGTDLSVHSQAYLNKVARQLNERPRQTLQFETVDQLRRHPIIGRASFRGDSVKSSTRISFRYTEAHSKR